MLQRTRTLAAGRGSSMRPHLRDASSYSQVRLTRRACAAANSTAMERDRRWHSRRRRERGRIVLRSKTLTSDSAAPEGVAHVARTAPPPPALVGSRHRQSRRRAQRRSLARTDLAADLARPRAVVLSRIRTASCFRCSPDTEELGVARKSARAATRIGVRERLARSWARHGHGSGDGAIGGAGCGRQLLHVRAIPAEDVGGSGEPALAA